MATLERNRREHADFDGSFVSVGIVVNMDVESRKSGAQTPAVSTFLLVFLGGAIGALLRALLLFGVQGEDAEPILLLAINTAGSFALGALVGWLSSRPLSPRIHQLRALIGTGLIGGFTSYSALALLTFQLGGSSWGVAAIYAVATLLIGLVAAWLGLILGARIGKRFDREDESEQSV